MCYPAPPVPWRTTTALNLREGPGADSRRLATLAAEVIIGQDGAEVDGWVPVTIYGWVSKRYLAGMSEPTMQAKRSRRRKR